MTLGEYLVALLEAYDVEIVFGIPGVHTVEMYRGLASSRISHVTPRHEQGAGFMADGYARASGKPGVAFVITGPGLTNIVTAMGQAYADSIPMLVISAVNAQSSLGQGNGDLHESKNQSLLAEQVAEFSIHVAAPDELPQAIARAFAVFEGARPRPVHIQIPTDLFAADAGLLAVRRTPTAPILAPSADDISRTVVLLESATRPTILLGGGCRHAADEVITLAEQLDAPCIMTVNARGILPPDHPLAVPASPSLQSIRALVDDSDVVLAIGTEMGRTDYNMYDGEPFTVTAPLIRIDIDPQQIVRNNQPDIAIVSDSAAAMTALTNRLSSGAKRTGGAARAKNARQCARAEHSASYVRMIEFLELIRETLPDATIVGDSTQAVYAGNLDFAAQQPASWFNAATGFGALGYGLPAAIGAKLAHPDRPVVCIVGDGGIQFTLAELGTLMEISGPLIVIVWNNNGYGEIKSGMIARGVEPVGVDLHTPDFVKIAQAYGMRAEHLAALDDLPELLSSAASNGKPLLIEISEETILAQG